MVLLGAVSTTLAWGIIPELGWVDGFQVLLTGPIFGYLISTAVYLLWRRAREDDGYIDIMLYRVVEAMAAQILLLILAICFAGVFSYVSLVGSSAMLIAHVIIKNNVKRKYPGRDTKVNTLAALGGALGTFASLLTVILERYL